MFALDPEIPLADKFGGKNASTIVDAGQYIAVADDAAKRVPISADSLPDELQAQARMLMLRAVSAIEEVLKWIPDGYDRMPTHAFFTDEGRTIHNREPGRFRRMRLEAVLTSYRIMLAGMS